MIEVQKCPIGWQSKVGWLLSDPVDLRSAWIADLRLQLSSKTNRTIAEPTVRKNPPAARVTVISVADDRDYFHRPTSTKMIGPLLLKKFYTSRKPTDMKNAQK
jgi:hypothetical protein